MLNCWFIEHYMGDIRYLFIFVGDSIERLKIKVILGKTKYSFKVLALKETM